MKFYKITCFIGFLLIVSCKPSNGPKPCPPNIQMPQNLEVDETCKTLLIIAEDRSGSTTDHRKFTDEDYQLICGEFASKFSGTIALRIIGNVSPQDREFYRINFKPSLKPITLKEDPLMSEKGLNLCQNLAIDEMNETIKKDNEILINNFLQNVIKPKVLGYKPFEDKDITDIWESFNHIEGIINEPQNDAFKHIMLLIVSDGEHDAKKAAEKVLLNPSRPITLFTMGWKDQSVFEKISDKKSFESTDGFLTYLKSIKCN